MLKTGVWVYRDDISKYITIDSLELHIKEGWTEGRKPSRINIYETDYK